MAPKPRKRSSMDAEAVARMMAAQDQDQEAVETAPEVVPPPPPPPQPPIEPEPPPALAPQPFDPGKVDGRTLRATGRVPFATRIKPEAHEALRRIAYQQGITMAEALERAVAAYDANQAAR